MHFPDILEQLCSFEFLLTFKQVFSTCHGKVWSTYREVTSSQWEHHGMTYGESLGFCVQREPGRSSVKGPQRLLWYTTAVMTAEMRFWRHFHAALNFAVASSFSSGGDFSTLKKKPHLEFLYFKAMKFGTFHFISFASRWNDAAALSKWKSNLVNAISFWSFRSQIELWQLFGGACLENKISNVFFILIWIKSETDQSWIRQWNWTT